MTSLPRLLDDLASHGAGALGAHRRTYPVPPMPGRRPSEPIIAAIERSGLRGRGGAAFPTATKMRTVAAESRRPVVLVNASEGEPASAKDKLLLSQAPHLVLDGALMAAAAVGADEVVIGIETTSRTARSSVESAIAERSAEPHVPVRIVGVPPRYVAGEETALVHLVNGGPAKPTHTPPRPFEKGVNGRPTLVNNCETVAHIAQIARFGGDWFRELGLPDEPGTVLLTLGGGVGRPGVTEVAIGTRLTDVLAAAGGTPGGVGAVLIGGYYGSWISAHDAESVHLSNADLRPRGAALGCGAVVVLPTGACGVRETARVLAWMAGESAGQCGPCVYGLESLAAGTAELAAGRAPKDAIAWLEHWSGQIEGRGACRFPDGAVRLLRSAVRVFADDIERHLRGSDCRKAKVRQLLVTPDTSGAGWR